MSRKKWLIILTSAEVIFLIVCIIVVAQTFDYYVAVAVDGLTEPWIGTNPTPIEERYNVPLMNVLNIIGTITFIEWFVANIIRFILIKPKYKIMFGSGVLLLIIWYFTFTQMTIFAWICLFIAGVLILWSHWIDSEEIEKEREVYADNKEL